MDNKLQKRLIYAGLAVLLAGDGVLAYYTSRMASRASNPEQVLSAQTRQLKLVTADVERANRIKAQMPEVQKYFQEFDSTLPPVGKGYSALTEELDAIAKDTHVLVTDRKFRSKDVGARNLDEIEIESSLVGDYTGIVKFLNQVQRSKNLYLVEGLELEPETAQQAPAGALKVSFRVKTYFRKA